MFDPSFAVVLSWFLQQPPPQPISVEVSVQCTAAPNLAPDLRITIRNDSRDDTAVLMGRALGNARYYQLRDLFLIVTIPNQEQQEYEYRPRGTPDAIAGPMDHWILPLPSGSAFTMFVLPIDFFSAARSIRPAGLPSAAEVAIRLEARSVSYDLMVDMAGQRRMQLWTGTAISKSAQVPRECAAG
jgi:hypothetical protein